MYIELLVLYIYDHFLNNLHHKIIIIINLINKHILIWSFYNFFLYFDSPIPYHSVSIFCLLAGRVELSQSNIKANQTMVPRMVTSEQVFQTYVFILCENG